MVAVEPVPTGLLAELLEVPVEQIEPLCAELARVVPPGEPRLRRGAASPVASGSRPTPTSPLTSSASPTWACRRRLSAAALETLAIVAYKQPVSRAQIAALRGVNVDGVVRLLEHRGYIAGVGRAVGPGQAVLYATTDAFLERLGLDRLDQLPPVEDLLPGPEALEELEARCARSVMAEGAGPSDPAGGPLATGDRLQKVMARVGIGITAGVRRADRRRPGHRERRDARSSAAGWTRPPTMSSSTACPCPSSPTWSTTW